MVFPQRFRCYLAFWYCRHLIGVWFVVDLLRCGVVHRFVTMFYLCGGDFDKQSGSYQSKISNMVVNILKN